MATTPGLKEIKMNAKQEKVIEALKTAILENNSFGESKAEIKECKVEDCGDYASMFIVVGRENDENTMASVYCRETRLIFIGKRGGVSLSMVDRNLKYKGFSRNQVTGFRNVVHTH